MAYLTTQQLATARIILLVACPVLLAGWILVIVLWSSVPATVLFGALYVALVTALSLVSVQLRRRRAAGRRSAREALARVEARAATGGRGVFVVGDGAGELGTQGFPRGWSAGDDPPPPYTELPPGVQGSTTFAAQRATSHVQATAVINENVYWNTAGAVPPDGEQTKAGAPPEKW